MIEIRHLRMLEALASTGSLSNAARRLHLSQPAISHQMKDLEDTCGMELFIRKTQPLRLTPAGHRLLEAAYSMIAELERAERDLARIREGKAGRLRIVVECHSCFDWLMPSMDAFRVAWPEVEMDLVSGFHANPVGLLEADVADLVIISRRERAPARVYHPLFRYKVMALVANEHALASKPYVTATDFEQEILVTYPIPDDRLDIVRDVLKPADVNPKRRTTELTVAILQLVASRRGIAAMPSWAVQPFLDRSYVTGVPVGKNGLFSQLYAATTAAGAEAAFMQEFIRIMRSVSFSTLSGVEPLEEAA
ncbi:MAG: LysR family transcriptional regulator [Candidatus Methylacidiphilales bacterium]|nr:LysR family transcriptional regulator [Candidatus Methylacidiphilales bacterium]